jgi:hypothetical protein
MKKIYAIQSIGTLILFIGLLTSPPVMAGGHADAYPVLSCQNSYSVTKIDDIADDQKSKLPAIEVVFGPYGTSANPKFFVANFDSTTVDGRFEVAVNAYYDTTPQTGTPPRESISIMIWDLKTGAHASNLPSRADRDSVNSKTGDLNLRLDDLTTQMRAEFSVHCEISNIPKSLAAMKRVNL